ncbi:glycosyl hydrolase family 18 [Pyrenophora seminiperda CCB06]|uniref:chitinase n=1 Tax=Pyrenophora seminiperda CCB06 TaxID=1302712 RepID=A0A3M7MGQ9_9PLEO|nr:glycosyl hydrolase family 18 [Pyrenophora seminiperda CCB06]
MSKWHPTRPTDPQVQAGIDHLVVAFANANATASYTPKVPFSTLRTEYPGANMMIAVGGWGDDIGYFQLSKSDATIQQFAADIATMLTNTGADGVDIDWEYPGGNGADYKQVPNDQKTYQIAAFPKVLAAIRKAIPDKLISIAVPGKKIDMIAYTKETGPKIWPSVDYINVMSYDLMNRRDKVTKHHTSVAGTEDVIRNYLAIGAPREKMNLGFAWYAKYFTTQGDCSDNPLGCPIALAEDPITGQDLHTSGAWTFESAHMDAVNVSSISVSYDGTCGPEKGTRCATGCCSQYGNCGTSPDFCSGGCQHAFGTGCTDADVAGSWQRAAENGITDQQAGGQYYFDAQSRLFWTWDTPELVSRKFDIVKKYKLGGVMAWSLGEDSAGWTHLRRMADEMAKLKSTTANGRTSTTASSSVVPDEPTTAQSSSAAQYSVVWVDGTQNGPTGDYSTEAGSPPDYTVDYNGHRNPVAPLPEDDNAASTALIGSSNTMAPIQPPVLAPTSLAPAPALQQAPSSPSPIALAAPTPSPPGPPALNTPFSHDTFTPDPGYVNPNWPAHNVPALQPASGQQPQPHRAPYSSRPMQPVDAPVGAGGVVPVAPAAPVAAGAASSLISSAAMLDGQERGAYTGGGSCRLRWRKKGQGV